MKKIITLILLALTLNGYSQDYLDKIASQTCGCVKKLSDTTDTERMYMELGICMIKASEPYKKQLKKDHNIDFDNIDKQGEELGKLIGFRMATVCPESLLMLTSKAGNTEKKEKEMPTFTGRVTKIDKDNFVIYTVADDSGKSIKFYWLTFVKSNLEIATNYNTLLNTEVKIQYFSKEFFDPKIGEYRSFNIIDNIEKIGQ